MQQLVVETTRPKEVIDVTDRVSALLGKEPDGEGACHLFARHTTVALTVMDLDPGTDQDLLEALEEMAPKLRYRHAHDPAHVSSHILSAMIGQSVLLPVADGRLWLGTWQRVVLVELDGPRRRELSLQVLRAA